MLQVENMDQANASTDLKKEKQASQASFALEDKRNQLMKEVQELVAKYDQDIYICLRDRKSNKVFEYASNASDFGLENVQKLVHLQSKAKTEPNSPVKGRLGEQVIQISAQEASNLDEDKNESTTESKEKKTNASTAEFISETSQPINFELNKGIESSHKKRYSPGDDYEINLKQSDQN